MQPPDRPADRADARAAVAELQRRLEAQDPERYPVQHATSAFHLGVTLLGLGQPLEAAEHLRGAAELFDQLPVERAKATNMLGVALRDAGRPDEAAAAFGRAQDLFEANDQPLELAASRFNLGLVHSAQHDHAAAASCFADALATFRRADAREQATAAARELGTALLQQERFDEAAEALEEAADLALRGGGRAALGTARNVLGIVHLQAGRPQQARAAFEDASGAHPVSVRPADHAMARSNLALACERTGDHDLARLAARQALGVPAAAPAVRDQARQVLKRVGDDPAALVRALDGEPQERWPHVSREEVRRLVEVDEATRRREVAAWVDGLAARSGTATELAHAWFGVLLEVPPAQLELLAGDLVAEVDGRDEEAAAALRRAVGSAMVRFEVPQWMRLKDIVNRLSAEVGSGASWG